MRAAIYRSTSKGEPKATNRMSLLRDGNYVEAFSYSAQTGGQIGIPVRVDRHAEASLLAYMEVSYIPLYHLLH